MTKTTKCIQVGDKIISNNSSAFIVAEAACNHFCKMDLALKLIDEAVAAGADAIKFQSYTAEKLTTPGANAYGNISTKSQYEYYKQFDRFGRAEYDELFEYATEKGIIAFSTPFDPENAQMLCSVHAPLYKIASCDLLYADLLREVAAIEKPIIVSTGGATVEEVRTCLDILATAGASDVILLACTLSYPTKTDDANFRKIIGLREAFPDYLIGISDHVEPDEHMISGAICRSLGAVVFEKHYALARDMGGGTGFSMTPNDLKKFVQNIRLTERLLGSDEVKVHGAEEQTRESARRSLVANFDLKMGDVLTKAMLGTKRPGTGILPDRIDEVVGKVLKNNIESERQLSWSDFK